MQIGPKTKNIVIPAALSFVFSFFICIISTHKFGAALLRGLLFSVVFVVLSLFIQVIYDKFLSDGTEVNLSGEGKRGDKTGSVVDITIDDEPLERDDNGPQFFVSNNKLKATEEINKSAALKSADENKIMDEKIENNSVKKNKSQHKSRNPDEEEQRNAGSIGSYDNSEEIKEECSCSSSSSDKAEEEEKKHSRKSSNSSGEGPVVNINELKHEAEIKKALDQGKDIEKYKQELQAKKQKLAELSKKLPIPIRGGRRRSITGRIQHNSPEERQIINMAKEKEEEKENIIIQPGQYNPEHNQNMQNTENIPIPIRGGKRRSLTGRVVAKTVQGKKLIESINKEIERQKQAALIRKKAKEKKLANRIKEKENQDENQNENQDENQKENQ